MKKKKLYLLLIIGFVCFFTTGCKTDNMEDIDIAVTNYPNEFIIDRLYGEHSVINQIYPDSVDIDKYTVTKKQKKEFAQSGLFVYTGLVEKERNLAVDLLDINKDLKIIDTSYVLESEYSNVELWLNPSSLLMMAQNVRLGLKEYITSNYLAKKVDNSYNKLKVELSELDADYRLAVENSTKKDIVVADSSLKFLEKFGLTIHCLDSETTDKELLDIKNLIKNGTISYLYTFKNEKLNDKAKDLLANNSSLKKVEFNKINIITDKDRDEGKDYITLMNENLDSLKQELYQ